MVWFVSGKELGYSIGFERVSLFQLRIVFRVKSGNDR